MNNLDIRQSFDNELQIVQDVLLQVVQSLFPLVMQEDVLSDPNENKAYCEIHSIALDSLCQICIKKNLKLLHGAFGYCFFVIKKYKLFSRGKIELLEQMQKFSHYNLATSYRILIQNMADLFSLDKIASKAILLHDLRSKTIHITTILDEKVITIWQEMFFTRTYLAELLFFKPYFLNMDKESKSPFSEEIL